MAITLTRNQGAHTGYRDNAVAASAVEATKVYGKGDKAQFDWNRV